MFQCRRYTGIYINEFACNTSYIWYPFNSDWHKITIMWYSMRRKLATLPWPMVDAMMYALLVAKILRPFCTYLFAMTSRNLIWTLNHYIGKKCWIKSGKKINVLKVFGIGTTKQKRKKYFLTLFFNSFWTSSSRCHIIAFLLFSILSFYLSFLIFPTHALIFLRSSTPPSCLALFFVPLHLKRFFSFLSVVFSMQLLLLLFLILLTQSFLLSLLDTHTSLTLVAL